MAAARDAPDLVSRPLFNTAWTTVLTQQNKAQTRRALSIRLHGLEVIPPTIVQALHPALRTARTPGSRHLLLPRRAPTLAQAVEVARVAVGAKTTQARNQAQKSAKELF